MAYGVMPLLSRFLVLASGSGISSPCSASDCPWRMIELGVGFGNASLNKLGSCANLGGLTCSSSGFGHLGNGGREDCDVMPSPRSASRVSWSAEVP
jgi:hypothetical protein